MSIPNGSTIWIGGLDDKERSEKILGNEYATIFLNETSQISFDSYEMIRTRLNAPKGMRGKMILDYNPLQFNTGGTRYFTKENSRMAGTFRRMISKNPYEPD